VGSTRARVGACQQCRPSRAVKVAAPQVLYMNACLATGIRFRHGAAGAIRIRWQHDQPLPREPPTTTCASDERRCGSSCTTAARLRGYVGHGQRSRGRGPAVAAPAVRSGTAVCSSSAAAPVWAARSGTAVRSSSAAAAVWAARSISAAAVWAARSISAAALWAARSASAACSSSCAAAICAARSISAAPAGAACRVTPPGRARSA